MYNIIAYFRHSRYPGYTVWRYRNDEMDHCVLHTSVWFIPADFTTMNNDFNR